jgi:hypothetical protein
VVKASHPLGTVLQVSCNRLQKNQQEQQQQQQQQPQQTKRLQMCSNKDSFNTKSSTR